MANKEELEEEVEETESETNENVSTPSTSDLKQIVITEMTRIINKYRDDQFAKNEDVSLMEGMNKKKDINNVINHIMNNLTAKRIMGGDDSITYEYIHEYYVDNFDVVEDKWSQYMRAPGGNSQPPKELSDKEIAKRYAEIPNDIKNEMYQKALEEAERAAKFKAEEEIRKREEKRKAKEKELAEKKKTEELAKKEAEKKVREEAIKQGAYEQIDIFGMLG